MTIFDSVKKDLISARKDRNADLTKFISWVIGELESVAVMGDFGKTVSDINAVAKLKNIKKKLAESQTPVDYELDYVEKYIPNQLTSDELLNILITSKSEDMASFMKYLKISHNGQYDGKIANQIAKDYFNAGIV